LKCGLTNAAELVIAPDPLDTAWYPCPDASGIDQTPSPDPLACLPAVESFEKTLSVIIDPDRPSWAPSPIRHHPIRSEDPSADFTDPAEADKSFLLLSVTSSCPDPENIPIGNVYVIPEPSPTNRLALMCAKLLETPAEDDIPPPSPISDPEWNSFRKDPEIPSLNCTELEIRPVGTVIPVRNRPSP
tara:strand:- start:37 stop:597 length:561 start_codon:yes stop_codon:yes gene_type:complete